MALPVATLIGLIFDAASLAYEFLRDSGAESPTDPIIWGQVMSGGCNYYYLSKQGQTSLVSGTYKLNTNPHSGENYCITPNFVHKWRLRENPRTKAPSIEYGAEGGDITIYSGNMFDLTAYNKDNPDDVQTLYTQGNFDYQYGTITGPSSEIIHYDFNSAGNGGRISGAAPIFLHGVSCSFTTFPSVNQGGAYGTHVPTINVAGSSYNYNDIIQLLTDWGNDNKLPEDPPIQTTDLPTWEEQGEEPEPGPTPEPEDPDSDPEEESDSGNINYNSVSPVIGGLSSFLTSYGLNASQINTLGYNLWSKVISSADSDQMLANFYKVNNTQADYTLTLAEILDYFVSLKWFPFSIRDKCETITTAEKGIRVGTGATLIGTNDNLDNTYTLSNPIVYLDGGELWLPYTYNSYMDFEPYTSVSIYVPYCGTQELQPSLVVGRKLKLTYCVDMLTGACTAIVMGRGQQGDSEEHLSNFQTPVAVLHGVVGFEIAMTGNTQNAQTRNALAARDNYYMGQWQIISGGIMNIGKANAISSALGNLSGGYDSGMSMNNIKDFFTDVRSSGLGKALSEAKEWNAGLYNSGVSAAAGFGVGASVAKTIADPIGNKITYENQLPFTYGTQPLIVGSNSNMSSLILPQKAFVQIRRRNRLKATNYYLSNGYAEARTYKLNQLGGFTKCLNPKLDFAATEKELNEIYGLLSTGVYLPLVEEDKGN